MYLIEIKYIKCIIFESINNGGPVTSRRYINRLSKCSSYNELIFIELNKPTSVTQINAPKTSDLGGEGGTLYPEKPKKPHFLESIEAKKIVDRVF